jgi:hypothetical protein
MPLSCSTILRASMVMAVLLSLLSPWQSAGAQVAPKSKGDSVAFTNPSIKFDSLLQQLDSSFKSLPRKAVTNLLSTFNNSQQKLKSKVSDLVRLPNDSIPDLPKERFFNKPALRFGGGYVNYAYNFRSNIDTPFAEKNIGQHNVTGSINVVAGSVLPLKVNYWIRQSNSVLFRNVTDVQVVFDAAGFKDNLTRNLQKKMMAFVPGLYDSLLEKLYTGKLQELQQLKSWLNAPYSIQSLRGYKEIVQVPTLSYDMKLPDSVNVRASDSIRRMAKQFIELYEAGKEKYAWLNDKVDSLGQAVKDMKQRIQQFKQLLSGRIPDWATFNTWKNKLQEYSPGIADVTSKYKWLMGVRNFSLGKSPVNYSELTAKNINVTGINFEYNSWYYLSVTAGVVDYRFRDFVINRFNRTPQYLYMVRAGLGRLEGNYFILSAFRGRKQLYASANNSSHSTSIDITGLSAETKWQLAKTTYIVAEAAESLSPDYRSNPPAESSKFTWTNKINKALSFKFYSYLPKIGSRIEGLYKYTGANYQSFSSFQTNAAVRTWYVKWDQNFFNRKLRITASVRSNEYTNPYIIQNYESNTIFKSVMVSFRARKWPSIALGYVPMTQLTKVGDQLLESRFQSLTASLSHSYKVGAQRGSSMLVVNKFYNNSNDSGFVYFNATNVCFSQQVLFNHFNAGLNISHSKNGQYELNILEENLQFYILKNTALGFNIKINNLNRQVTTLGGGVNTNIEISKKDMLYISYDKGYLPGINNRLVANDMASIQYSRYF